MDNLQDLREFLSKRKQVRRQQIETDAEKEQARNLILQAYKDGDISLTEADSLCQSFRVHNVDLTWGPQIRGPKAHHLEYNTHWDLD